MTITQDYAFAQDHYTADSENVNPKVKNLKLLLRRKPKPTNATLTLFKKAMPKPRKE